eukprot:jgi/Botrbrau1/1584/Bobra.0185s0007.1
MLAKWCISKIISRCLISWRLSAVLALSLAELHVADIDLRENALQAGTANTGNPRGHHSRHILGLAPCPPSGPFFNSDGDAICCLAGDSSACGCGICTTGDPSDPCVWQPWPNCGAYPAYRSSPPPPPPPQTSK